jgi:hypothetical protein
MRDRACIKGPVSRPSAVQRQFVLCFAVEAAANDSMLLVSGRGVLEPPALAKPCIASTSILQPSAHAGA